MLPRKMTNAYGRTCSRRRSLLPRKMQIGFRNTMPATVNSTESTSSTIVINVKISLASRVLRWPSFSPMIAPPPVASMTEVPKMTHVTGMTMLMPASASDPA